MVPHFLTVSKLDSLQLSGEPELLSAASQSWDEVGTEPVSHASQGSPGELGFPLGWGCSGADATEARSLRDLKKGRGT